MHDRQDQALRDGERTGHGGRVRCSSGLRAEEGEYRRWFLHVFPAAKLESNIRSEVAENVQFVLELRAPAIPCQGPDGKAPAWAVMDEQARGKFIAEADPVWQHATCHYGRREVRWSFPQ